MATMNISLPESMKHFVEKQAEVEGFGTVSEYLRAVIRLLQKQQAKQQLEELLLEGLGTPTVPDTDKFWTDIEAKATASGRNRK
jgi:antitoxin ParD1/3/4